MSKIIAAFVGVAHIHTPGFVKALNARAEAGEVSVKLVWDPEPERGRKRAEELGAKFVEDVSAIWSDADITAVVICAETCLHRDLVVAAAESGKDIFCEKPLGLGHADSSVMEAAITKAGVRFQTGFFQRSDPINQYIKREVAAGHLGKLTRAHYTNGHGAVLGGWFDTEWRWLADAKLAGGGALLDMGAHPLDLVLSTFSATEGGIVGSKASLGNRVGRYGAEIDEYGTGLLTFASGFSATIEASWLESGPLHLPLGIFGTEGQFLTRDGALYYQSSHVEGMDGKSPVPVELLPAKGPHAFEIFWDQLLGKPTTVAPVSIHEAALGSTVMERLYADAGRSTTTGV
jgi:predicted dehydrogenase